MIISPKLKKSILEMTSKSSITLGTEMFGVGDFWLEIRVMIKISKIPC